MAKDSDWFLGDRARALAIMHLTRRDDLIVKDVIRGADRSEDLSVQIRDPNRPGLRRFGVEVKGSMASFDGTHADRALRPILRRFRDGGEVPYPFCLLYFTMEDDRGYFAWLAEPIVDGEGRPRLHYPDEPHYHRLDRPSLDRTVECVNEWYDAFYSTIRA